MPDSHILRIMRMPLHLKVLLPGRRPGAPVRLWGAALAAGCYAAVSLSSAQDAEPPPQGPWIEAGGQRPVLLMAPDMDVAASPVDARPMRTQTLETANHRVHVVELDGETFAALVPLDGPSPRIVFDPARRSFARLLPSIRVETTDAAQLDTIATALGATGTTFFEPLGFAIVQLPPALDPLDAVARVNALLSRPAATVRIPPPPVKWR